MARNSRKKVVNSIKRAVIMAALAMSMIIVIRSLFNESVNLQTVGVIMILVFIVDLTAHLYLD